MNDLHSKLVKFYLLLLEFCSIQLLNGEKKQQAMTVYVCVCVCVHAGCVVCVCARLFPQMATAYSKIQIYLPDWQIKFLFLPDCLNDISFIDLLRIILEIMMMMMMIIYDKVLTQEVFVPSNQILFLL